MVSRKTRALIVAPLVIAAAGLAGCSSSDSSGPATNNLGPQAFSPAHDTSLTGTVQFTTFNIPAGVTVTAAGALTVNASGSVTIAGTLVAPCFALSVLGAQTVTITGTVSTACGALPAVPPTLLILGDSGYTLTGANIVASGPLNITSDTTLSDAGFPQSDVANLVSRNRATGPAALAAASQLAGAPCNVLGASTFTANPPSAANGADGSPNGQNGQDGSTWTLGCGGAISVQAQLTVTGQNGGNGGKGTSTSSVTAVGGNGGKGGTLRVRAGGPLTILAGASFTSGSGGNGGAGISAPVVPLTAATAIGGKGGDVTGSSGTNGPVDIRSKGAISVGTGTTIGVGHGGAGGAGSATGPDGVAGSAGGPATATGGAGGATSPIGLAGTNVAGLSEIKVAGGDGGAGGTATASAGDGGAGVSPGGAGGPAGNNTATGGNGGNAQTKDQNGNLIGTGGAAGSITIADGNGGAGASGCPAAGGVGGQGGDASGHPGNPGTGNAAGAVGTVSFNNTGNGGNGGDGNGPGAGGLPGDDETTGAPGTSTGTNFTRGKPGNPCPPSRNLQIVNQDSTNNKFFDVLISIDGGPLTDVPSTGSTYNANMANVPDSSKATFVAELKQGATMRAVVVQRKVGDLLAQPQPLEFFDVFGGVPTGTVTVSGSPGSGQENVVVGSSGSQLKGTLITGSINTQVNVPTVVGQATATVIGALPTTGAAAVMTLADKTSATAALPQASTLGSVNAAIPPGGAAAGAPVFNLHSYTLNNDLRLPLATAISRWRSFGYDYGYVSNQGTAAITQTMPVLSPSVRPAGAFDVFTHLAWATPTQYQSYSWITSSPRDYSSAFAPNYLVPTVGFGSGSAGQSITVSGQGALPYLYGEIHIQSTSGTNLIAIDAYYPLPASGAFSFTLPQLPNFSVPIGASGTYQYEATSFDPTVPSTGASSRLTSGITGSFGAGGTSSITINQPPAISVQAGACTTISLSVNLVNIAGPTSIYGSQTLGASGAVTASQVNALIPAPSSPTSASSVPWTFCAATGTAGTTAGWRYYGVSITLSGIKEATPLDVTVSIHQ